MTDIDRTHKAPPTARNRFQRMVLFVFLVGSALALCTMVVAEEPVGCDKFAWSLSREREWFAAPHKETVDTGETLPAIPDSAFILLLKPVDDAEFAIPPERKPKSNKSFGGMVLFTMSPTPGLYQVTLSDEAWVDVVQAGYYAKSVGHTGSRDCPGLRKSVRFDLGNAPIVLQVGGAMFDKITVAISAIEMRSER